MTYDDCHLAFTGPPSRRASLEDMRIPLSVLGALVAYFVWATSLSELTAGWL